MSAGVFINPSAPWFDWIDGLEFRVFQGERWVCIASLLVMVVTVSISVAVRYFNLPIPNVAEWAMVAMSPLTFVGAAMCSYTQSHIVVDVVKLAPQEWIRRTARGIGAISLLAFAGVYSWLAYVFFQDMRVSGERMLDMGTPVALPIFFLLAGMVLMLFHGAVELWRVLTGRPPVTEEDVA
ncbi:TRAP transporter small permease [Polaromonas sp.]|uniref:TRAP transporter small permease n=1 Tax=Polaromonas sp. TaxID=1869339 RepID=UPI0017F5850F|nr:TRAP transporter small permease [Polaromonas sp.]NMM05120.1 TRAP transporter small permease [Polaromonas sp.]